MYGLKLFITLEDLNKYIRTQVDERFKDATFIPFAVECNSNDLSIEITLLSPDVSDGCDSCRYRLDLNAIADKKTVERGLRAKTNPIDETFSPCSECAHEDWDMPQCKECNAANNFKYFEGWENNNG